MEFKKGDKVRLKTDAEIKGKVGEIVNLYINEKRKQSVYYIDIGEKEYFLATGYEIEKYDEPQSEEIKEDCKIDEVLKILKRIEKQIKELNNENKN